MQQMSHPEHIAALKVAPCRSSHQTAIGHGKHLPVHNDDKNLGNILDTQTRTG